MSLAEMLLRDELRREPETPGEVKRLLEAIDRRLEDAGNEANHPEARLEQAYHAILNCALVGLRGNGLRPTERRGHHVSLAAVRFTSESTVERIDAEPGKPSEQLELASIDPSNRHRAVSGLTFMDEATQ